MEKPRHYGSFRYGKLVEIFRMDIRLYRDSNLLNETDSFRKTMLGLEQMTWLKQAIPNGGFEKDFMNIAAALKQEESKNVLFITAGFHFAAVFEYPGL